MRDGNDGNPDFLEDTMLEFSEFVYEAPTHTFGYTAHTQSAYGEVSHLKKNIYR
jgi:hypothetical protein